MKRKRHTIKTWPKALALSGIVIFGLITGIRHSMTNPPPGPDRPVTAIAFQSTGRAIVGGSFSDGRIQRRDADGRIDESFRKSWSMGGFNASVLTLAIQEDDRIMAGGEFSNFDTAIVGHIARLNADGSLDSEFARAIGTGFDDAVHAVRVVEGGKLLVAGAFTSFNGKPTPRVARLNPDGTLDESFITDTGFDQAVRAIASLDEGVYAVGGDFQAYRGVTRRFLTFLNGDGQTH